jgi:DVNP family
MPKRSSVKIIGSKAQVFHGNATHTSGGLKKSDLVKNKHGRIVSRKKQAAGFKSIHFLIDAGYEPVKGKFGHAGKKGGKAKEEVVEAPTEAAVEAPVVESVEMAAEAPQA